MPVALTALSSPLLFAACTHISGVGDKKYQKGGKDLDMKKLRDEMTGLSLRCKLHLRPKGGMCLQTGQVCQPS